MSGRSGIAECLVDVSGIFFRAIAPQHRAEALTGSRSAGRYSRSNQPTLYLSASTAGVAAAMIAYRDDAVENPVTLQFAVTAGGMFDLRDRRALDIVRRSVGDPLADWGRALANGHTPGSWRVRDWIEERGAAGLIDPSRKVPGLWHLVLFRWNVPGAPSVMPPSSG